MPGPGAGARPTPGVPVETRVLGSSWVPTASRPLVLGGLGGVVSPAGFPHRQDDPASVAHRGGPGARAPHAAPPNAALPPPRPQLAPPKRPLRGALSEAPSPKRPQPAFPPAPPHATWRRIRAPAPLRPWKWEKGQGAPPCTTTPSALPRPFPKDARARGESDAARAALSWPPGVRERRIPLAADRGEAQRDGIGGNGNSGHPEAQNQRVRGAVFASQTLWDKRLSTVSGRPWAGVTLLRGKREAPPIRFYWGLLSHRLGGQLISGSQQPAASAGRSKDSLWLLQPHCPATLHDGRVPWEECKGKPKETGKYMKSVSMVRFHSRDCTRGKKGASYPNQKYSLSEDHCPSVK
ncbi:uncharacterized protein LOC116269535 [Papio anubis]|uniref:uncharacterized protein LOC116269535 n=1 Tax=Papio anubis TaxID=9555 RepID=UPI0012AE59CD|nr:uncharacterized protein LOC116269535 [Papio anubis]